MNSFLPSAVKFHYQFNLREMSNICAGLCRMTKDVFRQPVQVRPGVVLPASPGGAHSTLLLLLLLLLLGYSACLL